MHAWCAHFSCPLNFNLHREDDRLRDSPDQALQQPCGGCGIVRGISLGRVVADFAHAVRPCRHHSFILIISFNRLKLRQICVQGEERRECIVFEGLKLTNPSRLVRCIMLLGYSASLQHSWYLLLPFMLACCWK